MHSLLSPRHTRYTVIVMLFVWLMTVGIGIANACTLVTAIEHHGSVPHVVEAHQENSHKEILHGDKTVCLKVCAAEQTAAVKTKALDATPDAPMAPVNWLSALSIAVIDPNDRPVPTAMPRRHAVPVSIRFLRLTI